jgi:hypothetical protein
MVEAIANALVYAVTFINCHGDENDDELQDQNVGALESIVAMLRHTTPAEQDALAAAAERALADELTSTQPRPDFVHDYRHWMEEMFVTGWIGNVRSPDNENAE